MENKERSLLAGGYSYTRAILPESVMIEDAKGKQPVNVNTYSFENSGIIPVVGTIDDDMVVRILLLMNIAKERKQDIRFLINSGGGVISSGLALLDAIKDYPYDIEMYCFGLAASMAALLLAGGRKGKRFIAPHSKVMIHEPLICGGVGGSATSIARTAESILETKAVTNGLLADFTGKTAEEIDKATAFDNFFNAEEAIKFGLCDCISTGFDK